MRNLKKVLSLVLALAMVLSICMVGAGAVNYDDFTDEESITKKQAVETLVSLDVIKGYNDGATFNPTGNVTRAEMATMICRILAGGDNMIVDATKPVPTYADIAGHWAESYIEYCTSLGIVSGKSPSSFDPQANVTAAEAAKMVMTTLGYNADIEGFKGIGWDINTMAKANTLKLLDNLQGEISANVAVTREQVAQLLFNALDDPMVQNYVGNSANLWIGSGANAYQQTLLESKFNAEKIVGVVEANEWADLYDVEPLGRGKTRVMVLGTDNMPTTQKYTLNLTTSLDQIGESIIVYRDTKSNRILFGNDQATDMNVVSEYTAKGEITNSRDYENAIEKSALTKDTEYFLNYGNTDAYTASRRFTVKLPHGVDNVTELDANELPSTTFDRRDTVTFTGKALDTRDVLTVLEAAYDEVNHDKTTAAFLTDATKYDTFEDWCDAYLGTTYTDIKDRVIKNENGNYIKAIDYNGDGEVDFVLKTIYTATDVARVAKNGDVTLEVVDYNFTTVNDPINTLGEKTPVVTDDELAVGDVVLYAVIDGTAYAYLADMTTAKIDKIDRNKLIATTEDGDEYEESGVNSGDLNDGTANYIGTEGFARGVRNLSGKISYDLYFDRYGYMVAFTETTRTGNFVLLTDGAFDIDVPNTKKGDYYVEWYNNEDGKLESAKTTRNGDLFINPDEALNNSWGALRKVAKNNGLDDVDERDDDRLAGDNEIITTVVSVSENDDGTVTITPVENVFNKKDVRMLRMDKPTKEDGSVDNAKMDTIIPNRAGVDAKVYLTDALGYNTLGTGKDAGTFKVRGLSNTIYYYVYPKSDTKGDYLVKVFEGVNNLPKLTADDIANIEDVYAVGTRTTRSSSIGDEKYFTADVVVVEFQGDYKTNAKQVFIYDIPVVRDKTEVNDVSLIMPDGTPETVTIKQGPNANQKLTQGPGLYWLYETDKDDIYTVEKMTPAEIAKEDYAIGFAATSFGTGEYDYGEVRKVFAKNDAVGPTNLDNVPGRELDGINYLVEAQDDKDDEFGLTTGKYYTLSYNKDWTADRWNNTSIATLGGYDGDLTYKDVLNEQVTERNSIGGGVDNRKLANMVLVHYADNRTQDVRYAISFAHVLDKDSTSMNNWAYDLWHSLLTTKNDPTAETPHDWIVLAYGYQCGWDVEGGLKSLTELDDTITELEKIAKDYAAGKINLSKDDSTKLAALITIDGNGDIDGGSLALLRAEIVGHLAADELAGKLAADLKIPAAGSRAVSFTKDTFWGEVDYQHVAICSAATTSAITAIITKTETGTPVVVKYTGTGATAIASSAAYTYVKNILGDKAAAVDTEIRALVEALEGSTKVATNAADIAGIKTFIKLDENNNVVIDLEGDDAAGFDLAGDEFADLKGALESASTYTLTVGTLSAATNLTLTTADGFSIDKTTGTELGSTDSISFVVTNGDSSPITYIFTASLAGQDDVVEKVTLAATGDADGKDKATVTITLPTGGAWTLDGNAEQAAAAVGFTTNGAIVKTDAGTTMNDTATKNLKPGETITFTVTLGDLMWDESAAAKVTADHGTIVEDPAKENTFTYTKDNSGTGDTIVINAVMDLATAVETAVSEITELGETVAAVVPTAKASDVAAVVTAQIETIEALADDDTNDASDVRSAKDAAVTAIEKAVVKAVAEGLGATGANFDALTLTSVQTSLTLATTTDAAAIAGALNTLMTGSFTFADGKVTNVSATDNAGTVTVTCTIAVTYGNTTKTFSDVSILGQ